MGGYFSTRWNGHRRALTCEEALELDTAYLDTDQVKDTANPPYTLMQTWKATDTDQIIGRATVTISPARRQIVIAYRHSETDTMQVIDLDTTPVYFGGVRIWFSCPQCTQRCRLLYLPLRRDYAPRFLCRRCHDLTYKSSQIDSAWSRFHRDRATLDTLHERLRRSHAGSKSRQRMIERIDTLQARQEADYRAIRSELIALGDELGVDLSG